MLTTNIALQASFNFILSQYNVQKELIGVMVESSTKLSAGSCSTSMEITFSFDEFYRHLWTYEECITVIY